MRLSSAAIQTCLSVLVLLAVLKITKQISAPVLVAIVTGVILSPLVDRAERYRIPTSAVALSITFGACLALFSAIVLLTPAVQTAVNEIPMLMHRFRSSLDGLIAFGRNIDEVSKEVSEAISSPGSEAASTTDLPSTLDALLFAPQIAAQALVFLGTLFFFLLTRREIYRWLGELLPDRLPSTEAVLYFADALVSRYFLTITLINALFGCTVGLSLYAFGMPSPTVWGLAAFMLNYLLYLGPALFAVALLVAGHLTFTGILSYGPMAVFLLLNLTEGYFVTPTILGRRLAINPLLLFVTLTIWLWLWGPAGGIIALPVLIWGLAVSGQIDVPNKPVGDETSSLQDAKT